MVRRWMCGVVVVAMVFGAQGWSAPAMAKQPSNYYVEELWAGEVGAIAGGAVGFLGGIVWAVPMGGAFRECVPQYYKISLCSLLVWGTGRALGAGFGVTLAGSSYDVEGNVLMAYLLPWASMAVTAVLRQLNNYRLEGGRFEGSSI